MLEKMYAYEKNPKDLLTSKIKKSIFDTVIQYSHCPFNFSVAYLVLVTYPYFEESYSLIAIY